MYAAVPPLPQAGDLRVGAANESTSEHACPGARNPAVLLDTGQVTLVWKERVLTADRFTTPLYTLAEAARALDVPAATFSAWSRGYIRRRDNAPDVRGEAILSDLRTGHGELTIPFIGLAEGFTLAAIRKHGVPMQRIRPALRALQRDLGIEHALASRRLYTDGAELLFDYASTTGDQAARDLVVVRHGQRVFTEVVESYLKRISFADDGFAQRLALPQYQVATVIVDPRFGFGQPTFLRGRARVADVLSRFWAGETLAELADDFGVPEADLEDVVRVASRHAA